MFLPNIKEYLHHMISKDELNKNMRVSEFGKHGITITMTLLLVLGVVLGSRHAAAIQSESVLATNPVHSETKKYTVVIDSGHGGRDGGKVSEAGIQEKDINLSISLLLQEQLEEKGIQVIMTRTEDIGLYDENDSNKKVADMKKRLHIIEESGCDVAVSIHQNSYSDSSVKGAQVFYYTTSKSGKKLAEIIQNQLVEKVDPNNHRKAKGNDTYYLLKKTKVPLVIVECGFLSNPEETALLSTTEYQTLLAEEIGNAISMYLMELPK